MVNPCMITPSFEGGRASKTAPCTLGTPSRMAARPAAGLPALHARQPPDRLAARPAAHLAARAHGRKRVHPPLYITI